MGLGKGVEQQRKILMRFYGHVKNGQLILSSRDYFLMMISKLEGKIVLSIELTKRTRSLEQNAWYWAVVLPTIGKYNGDTAEDLHEFYKKMFLPKRIVHFGGKEFVVSGSTRFLNKLEFGDYIEQIRAHAALYGIIIPDPTKQSGFKPEFLAAHPELKKK